MVLCVRSSIKAKHRVDVPSYTLELVCIKIELPKSKPYLAIAWYRPSSGPVSFFGKLEGTLP